MSDPLPIPAPTVGDGLENIGKNLEDASGLDASKIMFYLGIGVIVVGAFILYKKAQEAKKLDSAAT